jgi:hypothetical protein
MWSVCTVTIIFINFLNMMNGTCSKFLWPVLLIIKGKFPEGQKSIKDYCSNTVNPVTFIAFEFVTIFYIHINALSLEEKDL